MARRLSEGKKGGGCEEAEAQGGEGGSEEQTETEAKTARKREGMQQPRIRFGTVEDVVTEREERNICM